MENDSPLLEQLDLSQVRPVIPKVEKRTLAGNKSPYTINGRTYRVMSNEAGYADTGFASWYGRKFHGHLTSNGEIYDMFQLSAAHTTLPIPSYVRVTNLDNGKSIIARVNDRGPFHDGRIVDMSYAGAVMLGYADKGTARVRVEAVLPGGDVIPLSSAPPASTLTRATDAVQPAPITRQPLATPALEETSVEETSVEEETIASERQLIDENRGSEFLQVGAFSSEDSARSLVSRLSRLTDLPVFVHSESNGSSGLLHKVRIGPVAENSLIQALIDSVQAQRLGTPFRVRVP
jgi:rare lipoprotein A